MAETNVSVGFINVIKVRIIGNNRRFETENATLLDQNAQQSGGEGFGSRRDAVVSINLSALPNNVAIANHQRLVCASARGTGG